jgi:hypothetical protein
MDNNIFLEKLCYIEDKNTTEITCVKLIGLYFNKNNRTCSYKEITAHIINTCLKTLLISQQNKHTTFNTIIDLKNNNYSDIDIGFIRDICGIMKTVFDDNLEVCYIHNATPTAHTFLNIIKKFIDKDTMKKIQVVK